MKFSIRTLILALAVVAIATAVATRYLFPPPVLPLDIFGRFGGTSYGTSDLHDYVAEINEEQLESAPKWNRSTPNPPVSANDAMLIAQEYRDGLVDTKLFPSGSQITSVELTPFDPESDIWVWRIEFICVQAGNPIEHIEVAVLMDKSVVQHKVTRRIDIGWPLPDKIVAPHNSGLSDSEVVSKFVKNLNVDRQFAGQIVKITGVIEYIPEGHKHRKSGKHQHLKTNDGQTLIVNFPYAFPGKEITYTGRLIGFQDLENRSESWDDLELFPGIDVTGSGY